MANNVTITGAYMGTLTKSDFGLANTTLVAGAWVRVGAYTVVAGEAIELGFGDNDNVSDALARIYTKFQTVTPAECPGRLRVLIEHPDGRMVEDGYVFESHSNALGASTDRTKQVPFSRKRKAATEDKKIVLEFRLDVGSALTAMTVATSEIYIDVTRYTVA